MMESQTRETAIKNPEGPKRGQILPQRVGRIVARASLDAVGADDNRIGATETGKLRAALTNPRVAPTQPRSETERAEEVQVAPGQTQPQQVAPAPLDPNSDAAREHELMKMGFKRSDVLAVLAADEGGDLESAVVHLLDQALA